MAQHNDFSQDVSRRSTRFAQNSAQSAAHQTWKRAWKRRQRRQMAKKQQKQAEKQATRLTTRLVQAVRGAVQNRSLLYVAAVIAFLAVLLLTLASSCGLMVQSGIQMILTTSYTAEDEDILAVEAAYCAMEQELSERMEQITDEYPGYDEYNITMAEIGHDPFALASYLTALYYDYTPEEVAAELELLFSLQYVIETEEYTETKSYVDENGDVQAYEYKSLNISLTNTSIAVLASQLLDEEQFEMFNIYQATKGNKEYLFEDYLDATGASGSNGSSDYTDYEIPSEALEDAEFAALIAEAEKYLGYPYVWGGSSPSTSFDCSGFVCYVLRASGVWNISRTTAQGIYNQCTRISSSEAQPGDLIFFTGTYSTSDAVTHVGIYVGNGMMLHCGDPISYTSINTSYWQSHFYAFGRY